MNIHLFSSKTVKGALIGLVASLLLCSGNASAQDYIGGSISLGGTSVKSTSSAWGNTISINVAPDLGWFIGDKWAVGIRPTVGFGKNTSTDGAQSNSFTVGINPYARYLLFTHNRFGLWAEGDPIFSFSQNKNKGGAVETSLRSTTYGVEIIPVLTYQLSQHIALETRLYLLSLSMMGRHSVSSDNREQSSFTYGLNGSTKDVTAPLGDISIGFLYRF